jgi:hypothetical protein
MTTSAHRLYLILSQASSHGKEKEPFLSAAAEVLSLEGEMREIAALEKLVGLINEIKRDIERLPVEDEHKRHLNKFLNAFNGLRNLSQAHQTMENVKKNFLKPENVMNITNIHLALLGHFESKELPKETNELATRFRELKFKVNDSSLPHHAKVSISIRINQIASILECSYAFTPEELKVELDALVGSIVVARKDTTRKNAALLGSLATATAAVFVFLGKADKGLSHLISIGEKGERLVEFFDESSE